MTNVTIDLQEQFFALAEDDSNPAQHLADPKGAFTTIGHGESDF